MPPFRSGVRRGFPSPKWNGFWESSEQESNTERKSLQRLLALVQDYQVAEVVVTFSDRLTRFGLSYLRTLFSGYGVTLTVLSPDEDNTPEQELTEDLLAIITSFAGRLYGLRSRKKAALVECVKQVLAKQES